jgi:hypothetical protein
LGKENINLKRTLRRYEFLLEDFEDVLEVSKEANSGLSSEINRNKPKEVDNSQYQKNHPEAEEEKENKPDDVSLKKLYRKIVRECHPDKTSGDLSLEEKAELKKLYNPEEANDKIYEIEEKTKQLENKINNMTNSIAWKWFHSDEKKRKQIVEDYVKKLFKVKGKKKQTMILGVGHPNTGTEYTSELLNLWGLEVGHEKLKKNGIVNWSLSTGGKSLSEDLHFGDYKWDHIVYCVRNPKDSIPSIVYTMNKESGDFIKNNINLIGRNKIDKTIDSLHKWNQLIMKLNPSVIYRIEDEEEKLFNYLKII